MNYWSKKEENKEKAIKHTKLMSEKYHEQIKSCLTHTEYFDTRTNDIILPNLHKRMSITCEQLTSVEAIRKNRGSCMCVLNFASYKNPGGKFLEGSYAQEESLCHDSFLYNVLRSERCRELFYDKHTKDTNNSLYYNEALYTPDIIFCDEAKCDVLTCAAPNAGAALKHNNVNIEDCCRAMFERIDFVLEVAAHKQVQTLILGAFGCGVFQNNVHYVAKTFKYLLDTKYSHCFSEVIFAVPDDSTFKQFKSIIM